MLSKLNYGSDIKAAREELHGIAVRLRYSYKMPGLADKIEHIIETKMKRGYAGRRGRDKVQPLNEDVVLEVKKLLDTTTWSQRRIAHHLNINAGRVSEIANRLLDRGGNPK